MPNSDTPFHSLKSANKTWTAQSWARCHDAQKRFMDEEDAMERTFHYTGASKTLNRHQPYFYTVIITQADRHTDGDQRRKRTKRKGKRTKRVHFPLKYIYHEEWCIPKQKQIQDVFFRLSLCYYHHLSLTIFCGLILVNFLHFKSLDHSNGCWLCSLLLDIKWSHLLVVLKISFKQDDGLHLSHAEYIQTCSSEMKQLRRDWMKYLH